MKSGLKIKRNKKSRWSDKETYQIVMAIWFWLLHIRAVVRLSNFVVLVKKKNCLVWKEGRIEDLIFCLWEFVFGSVDFIGHKGLSLR